MATIDSEETEPRSGERKELVSVAASALMCFVVERTAGSTEAGDIRERTGKMSRDSLVRQVVRPDRVELTIGLSSRGEGRSYTADVYVEGANDPIFGASYDEPDNSLMVYAGSEYRDSSNDGPHCEKVTTNLVLTLLTHESQGSLTWD